MARHASATERERVQADDLTDLADGTVGGLVAARAAEFGDKPAVVVGDTTLTYRELDQAVDAAASGLLALGLVPGDALGVLLPNRIENVVVWLGAARAGLREVPINVAYKGTFLDHALRMPEVRAVVADQSTMPMLAALSDPPPTLTTVVRLDSSDGAPAPSKLRTVTWEELLAAPPPDEGWPKLGPHDPVAIMLTSGTTGRSKGVLVPHLHNLMGAREAAHAMGTTSSDVLFTCLPLFHGAAKINITLHSIYAGATAVVRERFSASRFWDDIRASGATQFNALGSVLPVLLAQPATASDREHRVRRVFAAPAPRDVLEPFEERFGVQIIEGYGVTEIKNVAYNPIEDRRIGSFGKPTPSTELEVHDEGGTRLEPKEVGEIVYRPRLPHIMFQRYIGDPEATLDTISDLWWHTGDLGWVDEDGYFHFVDRKKDALRRRGENISSTEVEAILTSFAGVHDAAAVSTPSEVGEDEILVVLQVDVPETFDFAAVFRHCDERMPYFMVPRYFRCVAAMPRTPTGKTQKSVLRAGSAPESLWDAAAHGFAPTRNR